MSEIKLKELMNEADDCLGKCRDYSAGAIPLATKIVFLAPIQSERFAVKIYYENGECRKYVLPEYSTDEAVCYDRYKFTDKIWAGGKLVSSHKSIVNGNPDGGQAVVFENGYCLPLVECYKQGAPYSEAVARNEVMYQDREIKLTKLWDWPKASVWEDDGRLADEEGETGTGILRVLLRGEAFNWQGVSTLARKDGSRCSLEFYYLDSSRRGWFNVGVYGRGYNFINADFKFLNKEYYQNSREFTGEYARVVQNGEHFYINRAGKEIHIKPSDGNTKYVRLGGFCNGLARVSTLDIKRLAFYSDDENVAGIWGYVDETGKEVIKPQYIYAYDFSNGIAIVCKGKWENKKWPHRDGFCEGYWSESAAWGAIDKTGKTVIPFKFDSISPMNWTDNFFRVHYGGWENGKYGVIDKKGNWVVEPQFEYIPYDFEHDLLAFGFTYPEEKFGVYDARAKKILFEPVFSDIDILDNGDIRLRQTDSATGKTISKVVDRQGREKFVYKSSFLSLRSAADKKRYYVLYGDGAHGLADADTGKIIFEQDSAWKEFFIDDKRILFCKNGKQGICDFNRNVIVEPQYDEIRETGKNRFYEVKCGKEYMEDARYGLLKKDGTLLLSPEYLRINFCRDGKHIICEDEKGCSFIRVDRV